MKNVIIRLGLTAILITALLWTSEKNADAAAPQADRAMTNADVVREVQLGYPEEEIVSHIENHKTAFKIDDTAKKDLQKQRVSKTIFQAMFDAWAGRNGNPKPVPTPTGATPPDIGQPSSNTGKENDNSTPSVTFPCPDLPLIEQDYEPIVRTDLKPLKDIDDALPNAPYAVYSATLNETGAQVVGVHTVEVTYLNILRYDYSIGATITFGNAPTIPAALALGVSSFPSVSPQKAVAPPTPSPELGKAEQVDQFLKSWNHAEKCFEKLQEQTVRIDSEINKAAQTTQITLGRITAAMNDSSAKVVPDFTAIRDLARSPSIFASYYEFPWPSKDIDSLIAAITQFQSDYIKLSTDVGYSDWIVVSGNKSAFEFVSTQTIAMLQHENGLTVTSDAAAKMKTAQDTIAQWLKHFDRVGSTSRAGFIPLYNAHCDAWFGKSKTTAVTIATKDLLNPNAAAETANLVSVVCNPPVTVSTGIGISVLSSRTPAFVPGTKKDAQGQVVLDANGNPVIVEKLGYSFQSRARPVYALQTNAALHEWKNGVGLHGSLGADVGTANDTTTVGFLAGASLSFFRRTFFLTPALEVAQRTDFAFGFKQGDPQGNLTAVPTQTTWKPGFIFTFTFPVP